MSALPAVREASRGARASSPASAGRLARWAARAAREPRMTRCSLRLATKSTGKIDFLRRRVAAGGLVPVVGEGDDLAVLAALTKRSSCSVVASLLSLSHPPQGPTSPLPCAADAR